MRLCAQVFVSICSAQVKGDHYLCFFTSCASHLSIQYGTSPFLPIIILLGWEILVLVSRYCVCNLSLISRYCVHNLSLKIWTLNTQANPYRIVGPPSFHSRLKNAVQCHYFSDKLWWQSHYIQTQSWPAIIDILSKIKSSSHKTWPTTRTHSHLSLTLSIAQK